MCFAREGVGEVVVRAQFTLPLFNIGFGLRMSSVSVDGNKFNDGAKHTIIHTQLSESSTVRGVLISVLVWSSTTTRHEKHY